MVISVFDALSHAGEEVIK